MTDSENESKEINQVRIASRQAPLKATEAIQAPLKETIQAPLKTQVSGQPIPSDQPKKTNIKN